MHMVQRPNVFRPSLALPNKIMAESTRRLLLRVSLKLLFLFAMSVTLYALFSSVLNISRKPEAIPPLLFQVDSMAENELVRLAWAGGNVILLKRNAAVLASLNDNRDMLEDPLSQHSVQPEGLAEHTRSLRPELFVAFDRGTDMGCPLRWVPPGNLEAPWQPWPGGFRDSCRGSWYDAAGRVFRAQQAVRNVDVPPHRYRGKGLLEIGTNGIMPLPRSKE